MNDNFTLFFKRVLEDEGLGYEDVPGDNGGPTKCGITIADVARWNGVHCPERGGPGWDGLVAKVKALDPGTAGTIYKKFYWDGVRADLLPAGIDYCVVDYAVNSGVHRAVPTLGHLVDVPGDVVTDQMVDAVDKAIPRDLINSYQDARKAFLEHISQIPHNAKFRNGWLAREARVRRVALNLSFKSSTELPATVGVTQAHPKAMGDHPGDVKIGIGPPRTDDLPTPPHPSAVKEGAKSKSVWMLITAAIAKAFQQVDQAWGILPEINQQAESLLDPLRSFSNLVKVNLEFATTTIVFCVIVAVIWRHAHDKAVIASLKGQ